METNDKKIKVVFGATGRIGYALCLELKRRGEYVRAVCRENSLQRELVKSVADEVFYCDIQDVERVNEAVKNADAVYHLAGIVSIETKPDALINRVNVDSTKNIVCACVNNNVRRLVYVSSVHALGSKNTNGAIKEPSYYDADIVRGAYAKTKAIATNAVLDACKMQGLDAVIALPSGVIGPYEYTKSNIGQMIADVASKKLKIYIKGRYDFVDVRDVVIALADLEKMGKSGESYIISGQIATVRQILDTVADCACVPRPKMCVPRFLLKLVAPIMEKRSLKRGEKPTFTPYSLRVLNEDCNFSHEKLTELTGYNPRSVEESLKDQTEFYFKELKKD